jgi:hypothetical protein
MNKYSTHWEQLQQMLGYDLETIVSYAEHGKQLKWSGRNDSCR